MKSPGQRDYEADCARRPTYPDGKPRKTWDQLTDLMRWSWERAPSPNAKEQAQ